MSNRQLSTRFLKCQQKGSTMRYLGNNVVTTNRRSRNHGKPAVLTVQWQGDSVVLTQGIDHGCNSYAIELDAETAGRVAAELIQHSTRAALPEVMGAIGSLLA